MNNAKVDKRRPAYFQWTAEIPDPRPDASHPTARVSPVAKPPPPYLAPESGDSWRSILDEPHPTVRVSIMLDLVSAAKRATPKN